MRRVVPNILFTDQILFLLASTWAIRKVFTSSSTCSVTEEHPPLFAI